LKPLDTDRCQWVKLFIDRRHRPRFEVACNRRSQKDVWYIVDRLTNRHEEILRYPPCAKLGRGQEPNIEDVEKWLGDRRISSEISDLLSTSPISAKLPPNPSLKDVLPHFHGFGDWVVIVGRGEKKALILDAEMSDPLLFAPGCRSKPS